MSLLRPFPLIVVLIVVGVVAAMLLSPVLWVILWTDALVFVLVACIVGFALYAHKREHLRAPWLYVIRQRLAMAALVVLLVYVSIGLLDSLHFRTQLNSSDATEAVQYDVRILSVFDLLAGPLRTQVETTYSAPLAYHLYTKENIETPDGRQVRDYPRLLYGGAHLVEPEQQHVSDILWRVSLAVMEAIFAWLVLVTSATVIMAQRRGIASKLALRQLLLGATRIPWHVMLYSLALLLVLFFIIINLAPYYHLFGTDKVGQDVLYQSLKSIRTGLLIGTLTTLIMLPFAILLGIMAGHFRGWVDDVIQYVYTTLNSIPGVLLIAAAILSLQVFLANHAELFETTEQRADLRLLFLCMILGITSWTGLCRLLRGETLKLREMDYIQAARSFGVRDSVIITRHILPNVMHIVLIAIVLDFSALVLAEAVLSYVGVGVDPTMNSWGNMINSARLEMAREPIVWWSLVAAFVFMFILVLAANLFSDAVRDAFDPRLSGSRSA